MATKATEASGNVGSKRLSGEHLITITCKGIAPLLMDAMSQDEIVETLIRKKGSPVPTDMPLEDMARQGLYAAAVGQYGFPGLNLNSCLIESGRSAKIGRSFVSTKTSTSMPEFLTVEDNLIVLTDLGAPEWVVDVRRGMSNQAGARHAVGIVRPRFDQWGFRATLRVDFDVEGVTESLIRLLVRKAGRKVGICSFRPNCRGTFGRFVMTGWESVPVE